MTLEAIVMEIITTTAVETLVQLTTLVVNHSEYRGKSKGQELQKRIRRILEDERFKQQLGENRMSEDNISLGFKLGRVEIKGKLDLS